MQLLQICMYIVLVYMVGMIRIYVRLPLACVVLCGTWVSHIGLKVCCLNWANIADRRMAIFSKPVSWWEQFLVTIAISG